MFALPRSLEEAVTLLSRGGAMVMSGGTDIYPAHVGRVIARDVVCLGRVAEMRTIAELGTQIRIGGAVTWSEIARAELPQSLDALKQAARGVGSIQIQNRGTVAGNLCNASPAADGVPPLLMLDAQVEIASSRGLRTMALAEFITGYRQTRLASDEVLSAIIVPRRGGRSAFTKLGARHSLVISILMAAAYVEMAGDGSIAACGVAIGAASPVAMRLPELERDLLGLPAGRRPSTRVRDDHFAGLSPISDVRASAAYRMEAARIVTGEVLDCAAGFGAA